MMEYSQITVTLKYRGGVKNRRWRFLEFCKIINSPAHSPGSSGRRRPLSVCDGSGITNIYLKPHNRPIFFKNTPMADLDSFCAPMGQNRSQKGQSAAVPFKIAIRH